MGQIENRWLRPCTFVLAIVGNAETCEGDIEAVTTRRKGSDIMRGQQINRVSTMGLIVLSLTAFTVGAFRSDACGA